MFDAAWRSSATHEPARDGDLARSHGAAELAFACRGGETRLAHLFQSSPCRVAFPRPEPGDLPLATLLTTTGGLAGGDSVRLSIAAGDGAAALVTTQAAEKIYRALDQDTLIDVRLDVGACGWLEWLPQETILFQGARLRRRTEIRVADTARLLAGEILVFGRMAHGEAFTYGLVHESWRVREEGRLVWADALHLDRDIPLLLGRAAGFAGATAVATMIYRAADAAERHEAARALADLSDVRSGITCIGNLLVVRYIGEDAFRVRRAFGAFWRESRASVAGLPARLPRLWHV